MFKLSLCLYNDVVNKVVVVRLDVSVQSRE